MSFYYLQLVIKQGKIFHEPSNHLGNVNVVVSDRRVGVDELTYTGTDLGSDIANEYPSYNSNQSGTDPVKVLNGSNLEVTTFEVNDGIVQDLSATVVQQILSYNVDFMGVFEIISNTCGQLTVEAYDITNNTSVAAYSLTGTGFLEAIIPFSTYNPNTTPYNLELRLYGAQTGTFTVKQIVNWVTMPDGEADYYLADVVSATDYYPFGMVMPGRSFTSESYRFGFNGMEDNSELTDVYGSHLDFGARIYDSRLGRWLALDPFVKRYPDNTPYGFSINCPLLFKDPNGKEVVAVNVESQELVLSTLSYAFGEENGFKFENNILVHNGVPPNNMTSQQELLFQYFTETVLVSDIPVKFDTKSGMHRKLYHNGELITDLVPSSGGSTKMFLELKTYEDPRKVSKINGYTEAEVQILFGPLILESKKIGLMTEDSPKDFSIEHAALHEFAHSIMNIIMFEMNGVYNGIDFNQMTDVERSDWSIQFTNTLFYSKEESLETGHGQHGRGKETPPSEELVPLED